MKGTTDKGETVCKQCSTAISSGTDSIACEGFCTHAFHTACVNVTHEELVNYLKKSNFWWMCDQCIDLVRMYRDDRTIPTVRPNVDETLPVSPSKYHDSLRIDNEIAELKNQIAAINLTLGSLTVSRTDVSSSPVNIPLAESTLLSPFGTQHGTNDEGGRSCIADAKTTDEYFWLFFTRIKNSVTESDILKMVSASLNIDEAIVKKLVPAWKDVSAMPYISFKVGINVRLKGLALLPSTWPSGICFREFRNTVWEPQR